MSDKPVDIVVVPWERGQMRTGHGYAETGGVEEKLSLRKRFEAQVEQTPDNLAVMTEDETLTYRELNHRANVIAHSLLECTLRPPGIVPLVMSLGSEKIAAALGVLKANLAFAALDEGLGDQDLGNLVAHNEADVLLTDHHNHDRTWSWTDGVRKVIDVSALDIERESDNPEMPSSPGSIIAIRYTSGSTGRPKGVIETDRVEQYLINCTKSSHKHGSHDRVALNRNFWLETLLTPLCCGACLCPFDLKERGLTAMRKWMKTLEITVYDGMVTGFRELLGSLEDDDYFPSMRVVALAGESVIREDVLLFDRHFPKTCAFKSYYGSTEHGRTTEFTIDRERMPSGADKAPIGYPMNGMHVELWDEDRRPVSPGETGEIVVRGDYLSPGYWRAPELTAKTWPEIRSERTYVTGDLAVAGPEGCLYLLGRKDEQIKIRGHRIMPSEIEAVLAGHEGVARAAVTTHAKSGPEPDLVGYYVTKDNYMPSRTELRTYLKERLPHYMVPQIFVRMEALPLTGSGKVKRLSLPIPELDELTPEAAGYAVPENDLEAHLMTLWCTVLEVDRLGLDDDFFELGGDSLRALILVLEIEKKLGISVDPGYFSAAPTIRRLAELIECMSSEHMEQSDRKHKKDIWII